MQTLFFSAQKCLNVLPIVEDDWIMWHRTLIFSFLFPSVIEAHKLFKDKKWEVTKKDIKKLRAFDWKDFLEAKQSPLCQGHARANKFFAFFFLIHFWCYL